MNALSGITSNDGIAAVGFSCCASMVATTAVLAAIAFKSRVGVATATAVGAALGRVLVEGDIFIPWKMCRAEKKSAQQFAYASLRYLDDWGFSRLLIPL